MLIDKNADIWLSAEPTDMRKGANGLTVIVQEQFDLSPQSNALFIFYNRNRDKAKILFWHYNGFVLIYKCLESGLFKIPKDITKPMLLDQHKFNRFLEGLHFTTSTDNSYDCFR